MMGSYRARVQNSGPYDKCVQLACSSRTGNQIRRLHQQIEISVRSVIFGFTCDL
jgi:hypothetical protein